MQILDKFNLKMGTITHLIKKVRYSINKIIGMPYSFQDFCNLLSDQKLFLRSQFNISSSIFLILILYKKQISEKSILLKANH